MQMACKESRALKELQALMACRAPKEFKAHKVSKESLALLA